MELLHECSGRCRNTAFSFRLSSRWRTWRSLRMRGGYDHRSAKRARFVLSSLFLSVVCSVSEVCQKRMARKGLLSGCAGRADRGLAARARAAFGGAKEKAVEEVCHGGRKQKGCRRCWTALFEIDRRCGGVRLLVRDARGLRLNRPASSMRLRRPMRFRARPIPRFTKGKTRSMCWC